MEKVKNTAFKIAGLVKTPRIWLLAFLVTVNQFLYQTPAYADVESELKKTVIYKGTVDVLKGVSNVLLAITVLVTIALAIINGIKWQTADEQEKPMKKKALLNTIMIGVIVASIAGLIGVILNAYGLKDETDSGLTGMLIDQYSKLL